MNIKFHSMEVTPKKSWNLQSSSKCHRVIGIQQLPKDHRFQNRIALIGKSGNLGENRVKIFNKIEILVHSEMNLVGLVHLKIVLARLHQHPKFQLIWSTTRRFMHYFVFFYESGSYFWDASGVGQERDGHVVSWTKMMCMDSSFRMWSESADLDDTSITHEKA